MSDTAKENSYPNEKKVWTFLPPVSPDPFERHHVWVVQELQGAWVNGEWEEAEQPASRRVVYMEMKENGSLVNVYSAYNGNRFTQR